MAKYSTKENLILNDKVKFDNKGGAILGVLEGPVADFINPTRNGRHYGEQLWEKVLDNDIVKEQFANGGILGELDHPKDRDDICTEKVAVIMPEPPVKNSDGEYIGKFNILDTPCGRIVYTLAKAGFKLGVSSRGNGDYDEYTGEVDPDSYDFTCFDVVVLPAVKDARMNLITEAFDKNTSLSKLLKEQYNRSSKEDKAIMDETIKHLKENLDNMTDRESFKKAHPDFSKTFNFDKYGKYFDKDGKLVDEKGYMAALDGAGEQGAAIKEAYEKHKCVICGHDFEGYGNNAEPVKHGICCDDCNEKVVIPARLKEMEKMRVGLKESVSPWSHYSKDQLDKVNKEAGIEPGGDEHLDSYDYLYLPSSKGKVEFGILRSTYDGEKSNDLSISLGGLYEHIVDTKKVIDAFGLSVPSLSGDYADIADEQITKIITNIDQDDVDQLFVDLGYFKSKDLTESKETKDLPDISVKDDTLTVDIDDKPEVKETEGEMEPCEECKEFDTKLKGFLDAFLDTQGLEAEGEEEKDEFVKLFHETFPELDCHCDEHDDIDDEVEDKDTKDLAAEDTGADTDVELLEQLQKALKDNKSLKEELRKLQADKAVGNSKVTRLNEELEQFKNIAALAGKKALSLKDYSSENAKLREKLSTLNENLSKAIKESSENKSLKDKVQESLDIKTKENNELKEKLEQTNKSSKLVEDKYQKAVRLAEKYKKLAHEVANRYIDNKALELGVTSNEIKNRLNESYTLDDVDKVCEDLEEYSINISKLPFQIDKPTSARARLREDRSSDPLKSMDSEYDDTVDDYLLDLAGLKK